MICKFCPHPWWEHWVDADDDSGMIHFYCEKCNPSYTIKDHEPRKHRTDWRNLHEIFQHDGELILYELIFFSYDTMSVVAVAHSLVILEELIYRVKPGVFDMYRWWEIRSRVLNSVLEPQSIEKGSLDSLRPDLKCENCRSAFVIAEGEQYCSWCYNRGSTTPRKNCMWCGNWRYYD